MKGYRAVVVFPIIWIFSKLGEEQQNDSGSLELAVAANATNPNLLEDCQMPKYLALDTMEKV